MFGGRDRGGRGTEEAAMSMGMAVEGVGSVSGGGGEEGVGVG